MKLLILIMAGVVAFLFVRALTRRNDVGPSKDAEVVALLKESGSSVTQPHAIEFFLYFPQEANARKVGGILESEGYAVAPIHPNPQSGQWAVIATKAMLPEEKTLENLRSYFEALANAEGGEYDGWGAAHVN